MSMAAKNLAGGSTLKREAELSRNVKLAARENGPEHTDVAMAFLELGDFYYEQNRDVDSAEAYRKAIQVYEALGEGHQLLQAIAMRSLSRALLSQDNHSEAVSINREANDLIRRYQ